MSFKSGTKLLCETTQIQACSPGYRLDEPFQMPPSYYFNSVHYYMVINLTCKQTRDVQNKRKVFQIQKCLYAKARSIINPLSFCSYLPYFHSSPFFSVSVSYANFNFLNPQSHLKFLQFFLSTTPPLPDSFVKGIWGKCCF